MRLYDKVSPITWFFDGEKTVEDMMSEDKYGALFASECVLYEDNDGVVFSFEPLEEVCKRLAIAYTVDVAASFADVVAKMDGTYKAEGVDEVAEKVDNATEMFAGATAELGVITSQTYTDGVDTQAALAELGVNVADLISRVTALEGAKA